MRAIWFVLATMSGIAFAGDLIRIDDSAVKESFCTWHPSDVLCEDDPIDPPVDPNEPIDPCIENPEADGCPCPDADGSAYPDCPVDPPVEPCVDVPTTVADDYGTEYAGKNVLSNDICADTARKGSNPANGTLVFDSDGTFVYTPDAGYEGADSFWYQAVNDYGKGVQVKVSLQVGDYVPPVDPPVDPNEPPTSGTCVPVAVGEAYPECDVTYQPPFPPLGDYSVPGVCQPVTSDSAPQVTLEDRETLKSAFARLKEVATGPEGGILNIPYDVDVVQCDQLWISKGGNIPGPFTLRGIVGPNGEQPRLYCRSDQRNAGFDKPWDGTIPYGDLTGEAIHLNGLSNRTGLVYPILVENIHVDGYKKPLTTWSQGDYVLRNNYFHHGLSDGISQSNSYDEEARLNIQICGNEIAYNGLDNVQHGSYIHRAIGGAGEDPNLTGYHSYNTLDYIDNICHSSPFSHCLKSIANESNIIGNHFSGHIETDPTYSERYGAVSLIDVSMCAQNTIQNNRINPIKLEAGKLGDRVIGVRNRKTAVRGCDTPLMYTSEYDPIPPEPIDPMNVGIHTNEYWDSLGGEKIFSTEISGNYFDLEGEWASKYLVIWASGTYPNYEIGLAAGACWLDTPDAWYERSEIYVHDNEYVGPIPTALYYNETPNDNFNGICDPYRDHPPTGPGPSDNMIVVGGGEVYNWTE